MRLKHYIITLALATLMFACGGEKDEKTQLQEKLKELKQQEQQLKTEIAAVEARLKELGVIKEQKKALIKLAKVEKRNFKHYIEVQGRVESDREAMVSAQMPAVYTKIYVKKGSPVAAGQVIAELDDKVLVQQMEQVKTSLDLAKTLFDKQKKLWDQKIGTEIQYLEAKSRVDQLEQQLLTLEKQQDLYKLRAPIAGVIDDVNPKIGEMAAPGMPAFAIVTNSDFKLVADVADTYAAYVKVGDKVKVTFPDLEDQTFESVITAVSHTINPVNRTFEVEAKFAQSSKDIVANMIAYVEICDYTAEDALVVPVNLVQNTDNGKAVYVAVSEGGKTIARKKIVKVGKVSKTDAEILSGLTEDDKLISEGYQDLSDGQVLVVAQ